MILLYAIALLILPISSALGYWTWISGDSVVGSANVVLSNDLFAVCPGGRDSPMELLQGAGKLVMFGGDSPGGRMGDLWIYDIDRRFWNCSKGNVDRTTPFSLYGGVSGAFHPANTPSGRYGHEISVIQTSNELILFGGYSSGFANDLWQFNFGLNQWKLLSGSSAVNQPGIYGTRGIPDTANIPGSRRSLTMQYSAVLGDVVVFGGFGIDSNVNGSSGTLNDLWRFSMVSSQWTWVKGASLFSQAREVVITSEYHVDNAIGATSRHSGKLQPGTGNLIIATSNSSGFQLWSFAFDIKSWSVIYASPVRPVSYGEINHPSPKIWPGASDAAVLEFFPTGENMFFGFGLEAKGRGPVRSNDLWMFNLTSREWTFVSGSQLDPALAFYGIKGVPDKLNIPGGRTLPGLAYDSAHKKLYLKGGSSGFPLEGTTDSRLNDLWEFSLADIELISSKKGSGTTTGHSQTSLEYRLTRFAGEDDSLLSPNIKMITVASVTAIIFVTACFCWAWSKNRRSRSEQKMTTLSTSFSSEFVSATSETETGSITAVGSDIVYSVPGYLAFYENSDFRTEQKLAIGGAGDVYMATAFVAQLQTYGSTIVVKRIRGSSVDQKSLIEFHQEVSITCYLQGCRNIVRMLGYCDKPLSLLLKYYPLGSLRSCIMDRKNVISHSRTISFCKDISCGIQALHNAGFAHCDVKPGNILIDIDLESKDLYCVLSDFGIACILDGKILQVEAVQVGNRLGLSPAYAAPEIFMNFRAKKLVRQYYGDVYAFGIIMNELMTGRRPYEQHQMSRK